MPGRPGLGLRWHPAGVQVLDAGMINLPADAAQLSSQEFATDLFRRALAAVDPLAVDGIWIGGGGSMLVNLDALSQSLQLPCLRAQVPLHAAEAGGLAVLRQCGRNGMIVDLGQTNLKVSWAGRRWIFPRDPVKQPMATWREDAGMMEAQREVLRATLTHHLTQVLRETPTAPPEMIVLALPAAISPVGVPGPSSYIGLAGDALLGPDLVETLLGSDGEIVLLQDIELAALSALEEAALLYASYLLVATFGTASALALVQRGA